MTLAWALASLAVPALLGALAGAARLLDERAIEPLNRFALYFAFPALVAEGLLSSELAVPRSPGFWLVVPAALFACVLVARLALPREAPTLALILAFGNVAYLGLPLVERALGASAVPVASLAVAVHVLLGLTVGPALLLRWSGSDRALSSVVSRVARQPLVWAPAAGLLARLLPEGAREPLSTVLAPLSRSAAPVALFLLGLYLHANRGRLRALGRGDVAHVAFKQLLLPGVTLALAIGARSLDAITAPEARVLFLLSAMPAAITTFAIAHEHGVGAERTSRAIVTTTLLSAITIPLSLWIASAMP